MGIVRLLLTPAHALLAAMLGMTALLLFVEWRRRRVLHARYLSRIDDENAAAEEQAT